MGTSKANPAASDPKWRAARRRASSWARGGGGPDGVGDIVSAGATALGAGAVFTPAAQEGARRLGNVLTGFATDGVEATLEDVGLSGLVGKSGLELLAGLLEYIAGSGSTAEEAAVQAAVRELLDDMYDDGLLDELQLDRDSAAELFLRFFGYYLTGRILFFLSDLIEGAVPGEEAAKREGEIRDYVIARLTMRLTSTTVFDVDWAGSEGETVLDELAQQVLEVFGPDDGGSE